MIQENRPVVLSPVFGPKQERDWRRTGCLVFYVLLFIGPLILGRFRGWGFFLATAFGLSFLGIIIHYYTRVAKPEAHVTSEFERVHPGATVGVQWHITRHGRTARRLRISLLGYEKAKDNRGSSTSVFQEVFHSEEIADVQLNGRSSGAHTCVIPANAYPSFQTRNNFVIWALHFRYDLRAPLWPDHLKTYGLNVVPYLPDDVYQELKTQAGAEEVEWDQREAHIRAGLQQAPAPVKSLLYSIIDMKFNEAPALPIALGPDIEHHWAPPPGKVQIDLNGRFVFAPGETVRGVVAWELSEPVDHLDLRLRWYTTGKGDRDDRVVQLVPIQFPGERNRRPFELTLPYWPHSLEGKYVSIDWTLDLAVRLPGEQRRSVRQWLRGRSFPGQEITISPSRDRLTTLP